MIPMRLELRGFLTFRDTQVLDFSGLHSAVIIGPNGVGKSALFDAITFALFGGHRGGKTGAEHLLHQGANELAVRFDFEFGESLYRVERTLTRKLGRKHERFVSHAQAYEWDGSRFKEILETEGADACKLWVQRTLGMDLDACCATVLLRQNDHDQFLRAGPAKRQEILNALLDLEPYRRLEQAARVGWQQAASEAMSLNQKRGLLPDHNADTIAGLEHQLADATADRERLETCWATARDRLTATTTFAELQQRLDRCTERIGGYRSVVENADQTRAAAERHVQLNRILPLVQEALRAQNEMQRADQEAEVAANEAAALDPAGVWENHTAEKSSADKALLTLATTEEREGRLRAELQTLRPVGDALDRAEAARAEAVEYREQAALLDSAAARAESDAAEVARLQVLERERPWLAQLYASRRERSDAEAQRETLLDEIQVAVGALPAMQADIDAANQEVTTARERRIESEQARADARAMLTQKQHEIDQREQAQGEQVCSRCGAPIDQGRIGIEVADTRLAVEHAARLLQTASAELEAALGREQKGTAARADAEHAHREREERLRDARREVERLWSDCEQADRRAEQASTQLSDLTRHAVATAAGFPSLSDLAAIDAELLALPQVLSAANVSRSAAGGRRRYLDLAHDRDKAAVNFERAIPKAKRPRVRSRWVVIHDEVRQATEVLMAARADAHVAGQREQAARQAAEQAERRKAELIRHAAACRAEAARYRQARDRLLSQLAPQEHPSELTREGVDALSAEFDELAGVQERLQNLETAQREIAHLEGEGSSLADQVKRIPEIDRRRVDCAQAELDAAERSLVDARRREQESDGALARAREAAAESHRLNGKLRTLQRREADLRLLESLLGREHLQGRLVDEARIGIAEAAQRELDSISNGALTLDLRRSKDGEQLELLVIDHSSARRSIEAAYLSGSQRFRVAVAVALGIGQYISGAARGRRAVIIDEGFGSLDEDGIDAMAGHLRDLSDRLDRVLLVTHQSSMRRHFQCGFRVEKHDGAAIVSSWAD